MLDNFSEDLGPCNPNSRNTEKKQTNKKNKQEVDIWELFHSESPILSTDERLFQCSRCDIRGKTVWQPLRQNLFLGQAVVSVLVTLSHLQSAGSRDPLHVHVTVTKATQVMGAEKEAEIKVNSQMAKAGN